MQVATDSLLSVGGFAWLPAVNTLTVHIAVAAGVLSTLPSGINTFAACPMPLAVAGDRGSGSGLGGDATAAFATGTDAGGLEIVTLRRGALLPLSAQLTTSLGTLPAITFAASLTY